MSNSLNGFRDNVNNGDGDYSYDVYGNMTRDNNKRIEDIDYNHLNLPTVINFQNNGGRIRYTYNALGVKVRKDVDDMASGTTTTDYLDGFQYKNDALQFFPTAEGYVEFKEPGRFFYVYNYTDHLGNVRMSYTDDGVAVPKILEENHYYPFGLKHENYASEKFNIVKELNGDLYVIQPTERREWQYKYNGKEWQDELGLNFYDYGARNYDAAIGRWMNVDAKAEKYYNFTPYSYVGNMPIIAIDPDGKDIIFTQSVKDDGTKVIQMTVTGKLVNQSSNNYTKEQMSAYTERLSSYMKNAYSMSGTDDSGGKYEVNVSVNLTTASEDNPLSETDTAFRVVDPGNIPDFENGGFLPADTPGAAPDLSLLVLYK